MFGLSLQRLHWMNQYRIFTRCISKSRFLRSRLNPVFCKSQPDSLIFRYKQKILVSQRWTNKEYSFTRCIWLLESVTIQNPHDKGVCLDLTKHNESHKTIVSVHALNLCFIQLGHSYKTIGRCLCWWIPKRVLPNFIHICWPYHMSYRRTLYRLVNTLHNIPNLRKDGDKCKFQNCISKLLHTYIRLKHKKMIELLAEIFSSG